MISKNLWKTTDETGPINEMFFILCDFIDKEIDNKHIVSNELPCYISGH